MKNLIQIVAFSCTITPLIVCGQTLTVPNAIGTSTNANNVGIGTTTPTRRLEITGTQADFKVRQSAEDPSWGLSIAQKSDLSGVIECSGRDLQVTSGWTNSLILGSAQFTQYNGKVIIPGGNVGIGTNSPGTLLDIRTSSGPQLYLSTSRTFSTSRNWGFATNWNVEGDFSIIESTANNTNPSSPRFTIDLNGNVGIGTTTPGSFKLAVEGKIGAREVNVTTAAWSDYVFKEDYHLRPLAEVQEFINENHHLPDVPSEKEVLQNGQDLGAMNAVLLRKIEELTLYQIEANKKMELLQHEITLLKNSNK